MKAVLLVVLMGLSYVPRAYAADDAPVASEPTPRCYSAEERANIAKALVGKDARIKSLEDDAGKIPVLPLVLVGVLSIASGFAIGFGVAKATAPK